MKMMREIQGIKSISSEKEGAAAAAVSESAGKSGVEPVEKQPIAEAERELVVESGIKAKSLVESVTESELPTQSVEKPLHNAQQAQPCNDNKLLCRVIETQTTTESGRAVTVYGIQRGNFRAEDLCDDRAAVEQFCRRLNETDISAEHLPDLLADFVAEQYFV